MFPIAGLLLRLLSVGLIVSAAAAAQSSAPADSAEPDPVSVAIVVDDSADSLGSAAGVRDAVKTFVRSLRDDDEYAVVAATDTVNVAQEFTDDSALAEPALKKVQRRRSNVLYDGILAAVEYLKANAGNDRKALLLVSSGVDQGSRGAANQAVSAAREAGVPIYAIAVEKGTWQTHAALQQMAQLTGGDAFFPAKRSEYDDVSEAAATKLFGSASVAEKRSAKPLAGYSTLIIRSIPVSNTNDTAEFQRGDNIMLQKLLVSRVQSHKLFPALVDAGTTEDEGTHSANAAKGKVELLGTIVGFRRGSRLRRGTAGLLGSGVTRIKVQFIFRDAATKKPIFSVVKEGTGGSGLLAGDNEKNQLQAMTRVVDDLIKEIQRNRQ